MDRGYGEEDDLFHWRSRDEKPVIQLSYIAKFCNGTRSSAYRTSDEECSSPSVVGNSYWGSVDVKSEEELPVSSCSCLNTGDLSSDCESTCRGSSPESLAAEDTYDEILKFERDMRSSVEDSQWSENVEQDMNGEEQTDDGRSQHKANPTHLLNLTTNNLEWKTNDDNLRIIDTLDEVPTILRDHEPGMEAELSANHVFSYFEDRGESNTISPLCLMNGDDNQENTTIGQVNAVVPDPAYNDSNIMGHVIGDVDLSEKDSDYKYSTGTDDDLTSDDSYVPPFGNTSFDDADMSCDICGRIFNKKRILMRHRATHLGGDRSKCNICKKVFSRKENLTKHVKIVHSNYTKNHVCEICGKAFFDTHLLRKHSFVHTGEREVECSICNRKFANNQIMQRHVRTHYGHRDFKCEQCGKAFVRRDTLTVHMISVHASEESSLQCDECGKSFRHKISLSRHKLIHGERNKVECEVCGQLLVSKKMLDRHMKLHYGQRDHVCDICGKSFTRKDLMKLHRRIHFRKKEKKCCGICGKLYQNEVCFKAHVISHSKPQKIYKCDICGKTFPYPKSLKKHIRSHLGIKDFNCAICGRLFQERYHLNAHLRCHAGNVPVGSVCQFCKKPFGDCIHTAKKEYSCHICQKVLSSRSSVKLHILCTHVGEKGYECEICGKRYTQNVKRLRHIKRHHEESNHVCGVCKKRFDEKSELDDHKVIHGSRTIECDLCGKFFVRKTDLRDHRRKIHKPAKKHECKVCGRFLAGSKNLSRHLKTHYAAANASHSFGSEQD